jgi:5-methylthioribose kinase
MGLAHVADLDSISDAEMRAECQSSALSLGRALIVNAAQIEHIDALLARIRQNG